MISISGRDNQLSLSKNSVDLVPGSNLYLFTSTEAVLSIKAAAADDWAPALCTIGGNGSEGCKIWFSGQDWEDGSHEMAIIATNGDTIGSFVVVLEESDSEDAQTGMVQFIAAIGITVCLGAYLWLRERKR